MPDSLLIFLRRDDAALADRVRALSPRIELVSRQRLDEEADLLARLDVVYGHLEKGELGRATGLRWLQTTSAGVNSLITPELQARDLIVTTTSGIHAAPIAEQMFGMVLAVNRYLYKAWEEQKEHAWRAFDFHSRTDILSGKTLGVLGVGAIGSHAANIGKAFGMTVVGLRRSKGEQPPIETMYGVDERAEFLKRCDVVMNSLPLTDATRGFLGDAEFATLKRGAIVVNTGRGATINTDALLRALNSGQVGAACLDVTDPEPLPADHPLWTAPNVFITPHTSGSRPDYDERADEIFLANLRRFLEGKELENVVNKEEGY
ncbi:glyoxylate/hydroxypyruvate reductase B [Abditibacteriota bacterium]|nr:glyoxylate/hydroxypyruvate reductase B [Abditibacteriota bacterium]